MYAIRGAQSKQRKSMVERTPKGFTGIALETQNAFRGLVEESVTQPDSVVLVGNMRRAISDEI